MEVEVANPEPRWMAGALLRRSAVNEQGLGAAIVFEWFWVALRDPEWC